MRKIKLRAWVKKSSYGYKNEMIYSEEENCCVWSDIASENEIMLYIGLNDMNGAEIYEGDILLIEEDLNEMSYKKELIKKSYKDVVEYHSCGFKPFININVHDSCTFLEMINNGNARVRVIGNIYETPELLMM